MDLNKVYFKAKDENEARVIVALLGIELDVSLYDDDDWSDLFIGVGAGGCDEDMVNGAKSKEVLLRKETRTLATLSDLVDFALRGFKNAWEVAPDGYRLVEDWEREEFSRNTMMKYCWIDNFNEWNNVTNPIKNWGHGFAYAVPIGYEFKKPVKKMTVAEIAEKLGYDVEIVK